MADKSDDDSLLGGDSVEPEVVEPAEDQSEEKLSEQDRRRTTAELRLTASRSTFEFSGPLPPPQLLKGYNEAFAGCAERVVAMAERQSEHRQQLERMVVEGNCQAQSRGQWFAFILAFVVIVGGVYLLTKGKSIQGFAAIITAVASLIGALIYGRTEQRKEREAKSRPLPSAPSRRPSPPDGSNSN